MAARGGAGEPRAFRDLLAEGSATLGIQLPKDRLEALALYFAELKRWNVKVNLIARNSPDEQIVESHFLDSLTLLPLLPESTRLLDIGTGGGFPGLVCRAARADLAVTLVEPRLKRVSFLRHIVRTLDLKRVEIFASRIEDEQQLSAAEFSHITSRAVTDIAGFLEMTGGFLRPGGKLVCMKGPKWREELKAAEHIIGRLPIVLEEVVETCLPFTGAVRVLLVFAAVGEADLVKRGDFC